jgi:hypothetical protein
MNSQIFVRDARSLIERFTTTNQMVDGEKKTSKRRQNQQDLDYLCSNMTNPSLPSAYRLVLNAQRHKYSVDSRIINKVNQFN